MSAKQQHEGVVADIAGRASTEEGYHLRLLWWRKHNGAFGYCEGRHGKGAEEVLWRERRAWLSGHIRHGVDRGSAYTGSIQGALVSGSVQDEDVVRELCAKV